MSDRLAWNIETDDAAELATAGALADSARAGTAPEVPARFRRRFGPRFWFFYIFTLTLAAAAGFGMGRFAEERQARFDEIERALAIEALAQRTGDARLLEETLDPGASRDWRRKMIQELLESEGSPTALEIVDLERIRSDEVRVRLGPLGFDDVDSGQGEEGREGIGTGDASESEQGAAASARELQLRRYRFVNGHWLHAPLEEAGP